MLLSAGRVLAAGTAAWEFDMQITGPDGTTVVPYNVREYTKPHAH